MSDDLSSDDVLYGRLRDAHERLPEVPDAVVRRAQAIAEQAPGLLQYIVATLTMDSWSGALPALRSAHTRARQLLFSTDSLDVDLRISRTAGGWALEGQVLGPSVGPVVELLGEDASLFDAPVDEFGSFRFEEVPDGRYVARLTDGNSLVELTRLWLDQSVLEVG